MPSAVALPRDASYLVASGIVGPTRTVAEAAAMGGAFAQADQMFGPAADRLWRSYGESWAATNYYDRALAYFAQWARTANPEYFRRGVLQAVDYRRGYLEPNDYGASPHWSQLEGLEKHYLLTGDARSLIAVTKTAESLWAQIVRKGLAAWDQRIAGRVLLAQLLNLRLGVTDAGVHRNSPRTWAGRLDSGIAQLVAWQKPDGSYDTGDFWCHSQANYMVGLLNETLVKIHGDYRADPQIVTLVRRSADYMWATQWRADRQAFQYLNIACSGVGTTNPAGDLNGLIVGPWSWLAKATGDATYVARGDAIYAGLVRNAYLTSNKQFNQAFAASYRYLGDR